MFAETNESQQEDEYDDNQQPDHANAVVCKATLLQREFAVVGRNIGGHVIILRRQFRLPPLEKIKRKRCDRRNLVGAPLDTGC
jgi:hypothetical protein